MLRVRHLLRNEFRMQRRGYDTTLALDEDIHSASTIECPGPPSTCDISRYFDHPMDSSVSFDSAARCCGTHVTSGQDCTFCWLQLIRFCHLSQPFLLPASPLQHLWRLLLAWLLLVQCLRHLDLYSIYTGFELPSSTWTIFCHCPFICHLPPANSTRPHLAARSTNAVTEVGYSYVANTLDNTVDAAPPELTLLGFAG